MNVKQMLFFFNFNESNQSIVLLCDYFRKLKKNEAKYILNSFRFSTYTGISFFFHCRKRDYEIENY